MFTGIAVLGVLGGTRSNPLDRIAEQVLSLGQDCRSGTDYSTGFTQRTEQPQPG